MKVITVVNIFFIMGIMAAMSCGSGSTASKSGTKSKAGDHYEDLSAYRPEIMTNSDSAVNDGTADPGNTINPNLKPENDVTSSVNMLLDSINYLKSNINYIDGFTIQVYTGINREQANDAKAKVYTTLPDSRPVIIYDQPNFRVKVGKFYTRREAQGTFAALKSVFPAAILIPERLPIE